MPKTQTGKQGQMNKQIASPEGTPVSASSQLARRDRDVVRLLSGVSGEQNTLALLGLLL